MTSEGSETFSAINAQKLSSSFQGVSAFSAFEFFSGWNRQKWSRCNVMATGTTDLFWRHFGCYQWCKYCEWLKRDNIKIVFFRGKYKSRVQLSLQSKQARAGKFCNFLIEFPWNIKSRVSWWVKSNKTANHKTLTFQCTTRMGTALCLSSRWWLGKSLQEHWDGFGRQQANTMKSNADISWIWEREFLQNLHAIFCVNFFMWTTERIIIAHSHRECWCD